VLLKNSATEYILSG